MGLKSHLRYHLMMRCVHSNYHQQLVSYFQTMIDHCQKTMDKSLSLTLDSDSTEYVYSLYILTARTISRGHRLHQLQNHEK